MSEAIDAVNIKLWGITVGATMWDGDLKRAVFNYEEDFEKRGLQVSPFMTPVGHELYFGRREEAFAGLETFIADSLPDKFGNTIISAYFDRLGRKPSELTPIDRLAYIGERAMGALVFEPEVKLGGKKDAEAIVLSQLVAAARKAIDGNLNDNDAETEEALNRLISVGISAGGARAKAVINYHPETGEMKSGQFPAEEGFEPWLIKFDGVGKDSALGASEKYGRIEYAYYLMAKAAGIEMTTCRLLNENGRAHFMTKRFDRDGAERIHMQSLCAMKGLDFNMSTAHSYEQYFQTILELTEDASQVQEGIKRCFFNVLARNQDDHTKNVSFLMNREGEWRIAPAFDVTYAFNPNDGWTSAHQMSINGKFRGINTKDLLASAKGFASTIRAKNILEEVKEAVMNWSEFAGEAGLTHEESHFIKENHRI